MKFQSIETLLGNANRFTTPFSSKNKALLDDFSTSGDDRIVNRLVIDNQRLVHKVAKRYLSYMSNDMALEDLLAAGNLGLVIAIKRFKPEMETTLSTYAVHWIRQSILRAIYNTGFRIRVPVHRFEDLRRLLIFERLYGSSGQTLSIEAYAEYLDMDPAKVALLFKIRHLIHCNRLSLDFPTDSDEPDGTSLVDQIPCTESIKPYSDPTFHLLFEDRENRMKSLLARLSDKQQFVLIHRFGLFGNEPQTLEQLGEKLLVTRERIRQIEKQSLEKLKVAARQLFDYDEWE